MMPKKAASTVAGGEKNGHAKVTDHTTLLEGLAERTGLSFLQLAALLDVVLVLLVVLAAYADGILAQPFNPDFWRTTMMAPVAITYVLLVQPVFKRLRIAAIDAFSAVVPLDDEALTNSLARASIYNRGLEWLAFGIGAAVWLVLSQPWSQSGPAWTWSSVGQSIGLTIVGLLSGTLLYAVMGWFVYSTLSGTRLYSQVYRQPLDLNIHDIWSLEPIGRWSLGVSVTYLVGITVSLFFLPWLTLTIESVLVYPVLIVAAILVFFLNMQRIHAEIVVAKKRELRMVHERMTEASRVFNKPGAGTSMENRLAGLNYLSALSNYEKKVRSMPEWPFTADIMRSLAFSSLLPVAAGVIRRFLPDILTRLLPAELLDQLQRWFLLP